MTAPRRGRHAGCWAHPRRLVLEQAKQHPELELLVDAILDLSRVDELGILGSEAHLAMRRSENFRSLMTFLSDPRLPLDNRRSENALRIVALIPKSSLSVGHQEAGENLAALQSLVMGRVTSDLNLEDDLAELLVRIHVHVASAIDEILLHRWARSSRRA